MEKGEIEKDFVTKLYLIDDILSNMNISLLNDTELHQLLMIRCHIFKLKANRNLALNKIYKEEVYLKRAKKYDALHAYLLQILEGKHNKLDMSIIKDKISDIVMNKND